MSFKSLLFFVVILIGMHNTQASYASDWNIAGIQLGMSTEDAISSLKSKVPNIRIEVIKKSFRDNITGQQSPMCIFGIKAHVDKNPKIKLVFEDGIDRLILACNPNSSRNEILGIKRVIRFTDPSHPSQSAVYSSLIEKYGKPTFEEQYNYLWLIKISEEEIKRHPDRFHFWEFEQGIAYTAEGNYSGFKSWRESISIEPGTILYCRNRKDRVELFLVDYDALLSAGDTFLAMLERKSRDNAKEQEKLNDNIKINF